VQYAKIRIPVLHKLQIKLNPYEPAANEPFSTHQISIASQSFIGR
jgi:hypothetical protein